MDMPIEREKDGAIIQKQHAEPLNYHSGNETFWKFHLLSGFTHIFQIHQQRCEVHRGL